MERIYKTEDLESGMTISEEINIMNGLIVFKSGIQLDNNIIDLLKKYQIDEVSISEIYDTKIIETNIDLAEKRKEIEHNKKMMFQDCLNDEYMNELYKIVCDMQLMDGINE